MSQDKKLFVLTITNTFKKVDLFRVHIYEHSIRFNKKLENGIEKHPDLKEEVDELNDLWVNHRIQESQILPILLYLMAKYGSYLKNFYFKEHELDSNGHYIERVDNEEESDYAGFYEYFKNGKKLKVISKLEFEKHFPNDEIKDQYLDNYKSKGARFYIGGVSDKSSKNLYFMTFNKKLIMTYEA